MTPQEYERHKARTVVSSTGCWVWQGAILQSPRKGGGGYALAQVGGKTTLLHRAMYEHVVGAIPTGATLDHLCRVRACVNPAHLEPVTQKVNTLRGSGPTAVNAVCTHCPQGHPYAGENLYVDPTGRRHCRECRRTRTRAWYSEQGGKAWKQAWNRQQKESH